MNPRIILISNQPALREELTALFAQQGYGTASFGGDPAISAKALAESDVAAVAIDASDKPGVLSPREREIFSLLAAGLTGKQAAGRLYISPETVRTHVRNAMQKLGAHTRAHAIVLALTAGEVFPQAEAISEK